MKAFFTSLLVLATTFSAQAADFTIKVNPITKSLPIYVAKYNGTVIATETKDPSLSTYYRMPNGATIFPNITAGMLDQYSGDIYYESNDCSGKPFLYTRQQNPDLYELSISNGKLYWSPDYKNLGPKAASAIKTPTSHYDDSGNCLSITGGYSDYGIYVQACTIADCGVTDPKSILTFEQQ